MRPMPSQVRRDSILGDFWFYNLVFQKKKKRFWNECSDDGQLDMVHENSTIVFMYLQKRRSWSGVSFLPHQEFAWIWIAAFVVFVCLLFLTHMAWVAIWPSKQYVLVIDAGSSGTRMNAFRVIQGEDSAYGIPKLVAVPPDAAPHKVPRRALETRRAYKRVETEPGLEKFSDKLHQIGPESIYPLLDWARAIVPAQSWSVTPVFLFGTAGMRRMNSMDQNNVMTEIRSILSLSGLNFQPEWARVISGTEEGVFGWISLNAASGMLGSDTTFGALDLGGSSLEVTYAIPRSLANDSENNQTKLNTPNVSLLGAEYSLYTQSHYHFGLDDAFERSVSLLVDDKKQMQSAHRGRRKVMGIDQNPESNTLHEANGPESHESKKLRKEKSIEKEYEGKMNQIRSLTSNNSKKDILGMNPDSVADIVISHPCLHNGYFKEYERVPLDGVDPEPKVVYLRGAPNFDSCRDLSLSVVRTPTHCASPPCFLKFQNLESKNNFAALSGFYVVAHFFDVLDNVSNAKSKEGKVLKVLDKSSIVDDIIHAGRAFCALDWKEVELRHEGELLPETYCFRAPYIQSLLMDGLGLENDQIVMPGPGTSWTLGAALAEGHKLANLFSQKTHQPLLSSNYQNKFMLLNSPITTKSGVEVAVYGIVALLVVVIIFFLVRALSSKSILWSVYRIYKPVRLLRQKMVHWISFNSSYQSPSVFIDRDQEENPRVLVSANIKGNRIPSLPVGTTIVGGHMTRSHTYSRRLNNLENGI